MTVHQTARLIDGRHWADTIEGEVRDLLKTLIAQGRPRPGLTVVLVGDDPASAVYVRSKGQACERVGIASDTLTLPRETPQAELLDLLARLNADPAVHGILVQLPLPAHIDSQTILEAIDPRKDVDGFHPYNAGRLNQGHPTLVSATPAGVMELLAREGIPVAGARAVVIGRSNIVGRPVAALLLNAHATVTVCHSRTRDLGAVVRDADIVVAAIGQPGFVKADWIKPGAAVIDVGINRLEDKRLVGDVDFDAVKEVAGWITPVPKGVGPMTIACLLSNTLKAYQAQLGDPS